MAPRYMQMLCPRCGGPTHLDQDGKRRTLAYFCDDWKGCGWTNSRAWAAYQWASEIERQKKDREQPGGG